uniref:Uncharacterized protein n=1 Tax=Panagrolaimus sp. ES5 TaxID=591445 RepID=A0AC34G9G7_9BILA
MDPPPIITKQQAYLNFWNSLNNCLEDEHKIHPANGIEPTFEESENLWNSMKEPRRRKLLWIATGFIHEDFPEDKEQFIKEESNGVIFETNVEGRGSDDDLSSDEEDLPNLNDENLSPNLDNHDVEVVQNANIENANFNLNQVISIGNKTDASAEIEIIELSSDED